jgi:deoxyribodipyrimidine photo-lyase
MRKYDTKLFLKNGIKDSEPISRNMYYVHFEKWKNGQTGNQFVDANMNELNATGFMSNRGRQNVASYLCNDLKLDWRYGAAYFEEQLIDYDVCSNWGNWAYIAGVGNDPRGHRFFNVEKQAHDYDKEHKYRELWKN